MKIRKYITLNLIALVSYIHLWQSIGRYNNEPFDIWKHNEDFLWEVFENILNYSSYKFQVYKDFILEKFWLILLLLFLVELIFNHKYPNKLKEINIKNKVSDIIHGLFFYFSYIYMFYIILIYFVYIFSILFIYSVIFTS